MERTQQMPKEAATIIRFILVGLVNTGLGFLFILAGLWAGAGDYGANAIGFALGLPISYMLHRVLTFRPQHAASWGEIGRYLGAFLISYAVNLGVVTAGRIAGYQENPLVQAAAICAYAATFYIISRMLVFRQLD
ncbi:GtrA family protein [Aurantiacibacter poecillastricola]|uniref:GtrA family protein n=1 Tax=Aurantiacibacter poecillastricola TaxID=3064385 RepID=UPI0027400AA7|nr:GtrA family protein [Aurantiacibacter sp. 219JJ12-13]MDP5262421.1 GtrA family protein [Aurantiacibacter sp. 219JJ12-13]